MSRSFQHGIGKQRFQLLEMLARGGVENHGSPLPVRGDSPNAVTKPLETTTGLRCPEIDV